MLLVARGIKAHGIRGDVKIDCLMDNPDSFSKLSEIVVKGKTYKIERVRANNSYPLLKLVGVDTMEQAEFFRNTDIFVPRDKLPTPPKDTYYIDDLIGCKAMLDGKELGILTDIYQNGSADVYVITQANDTVMFPCIEGVMEKVDIDGKTIYLNKEEFEKVAVYED